MVPISDLSVLSAKLNQASDEINHLLKDIEAQLFELNLGVEAWTEPFIARNTTQEAAEGYVSEVQSRLGWSKRGGKWQLCLKHETIRRSTALDGYGNPAEEQVLHEEVQQLASESRSMKAKALAHIEDLVRSLTNEANQILKSVEDARKFASQAIDDVIAVPGGSMRASEYARQVNERLTLKI